MSVWHLDTKTLETVKKPYDIVNEYCKELYEQTGGKLVARVTGYDGRYKSGIRPSLQGVISAAAGVIVNSSLQMNASEAQKFDVQDVMGEYAGEDPNGDQFVYELYVTSQNTPKYKFRAFIMYHGIDIFPVGLTIEENIAEELKLPTEGKLCNDEAEFRSVVERILGSETLTRVLQNLAVLNL